MSNVHESWLSGYEQQVRAASADAGMAFRGASWQHILSLLVTPAADTEQPSSDLRGRPVGSGMHLVPDAGGASPLQGWH